MRKETSHLSTSRKNFSDYGRYVDFVFAFPRQGNGTLPWLPVEQPAKTAQHYVQF